MYKQILMLYLFYVKIEFYKKYIVFFLHKLIFHIKYKKLLKTQEIF